MGYFNRRKRLSTDKLKPIAPQQTCGTLCANANSTSLGAALVGDTVYIAGGEPVTGGSLMISTNEAFTLSLQGSRGLK